MNTSWLSTRKTSAIYERRGIRTTPGPDTNRKSSRRWPTKKAALENPEPQTKSTHLRVSKRWPLHFSSPPPPARTANPGPGAPFLLQALPGSALMVCILVMAIFMTLGVSLLVNSGLFLQTHGLRKLTRLTSCAAENGIKQAWNRVEARAEEVFSGTEIDQETFLDLKQAPESKGLEIIRSLLEAGSVGQEDDFSGLRWETVASAGLAELYSDEHYLKATFGFNIKSSGRVQEFAGARIEEVKCELVLLAGHLPLDQVPAAISKEGIKEGDLNNLKVLSLVPGPTAVAGPKIVSKRFIPDYALPLLSRGLKILKPGSLPNWLLRRALGLEPGSEPVPDGVYLVQDSLGPGGIYVQGDLSQLLLGIDSGFQVIQFKQGESLWLLRFNPTIAKTSFISPSGSQNFNELPVPLIMINGRVLELAAGRADSSGVLKVADGEDAPAFLGGLKLTIVCSGKISLTTNLFSNSLDWREGLPYLRSKQSQLIIWSTGKDFQSEEVVDGGISLLGEAGRRAVFEASLIAGGQGFSAEAAGGKINLIGSLAATVLDTGQTEITTYTLPSSPLSLLSEPDLRVYSGTALLHLSHIKILEWRPSK